MSMGDIFTIAGSGMSAQTVRLNTVSSNIANADSVSSSVGGTYRAREPVFKAVQQALYDANNGGQPLALGQDAAGVQVAGIVESQAPLQMKFEPQNPYADKNGYVAYPNVNVVEEMANMISASRSFQTNVDVMNTAKTLMQKTLTLGQ
ncbi:MAG: flagellar basal body rod protein FlgC [Pseudomonadales bacterium]|nr:flagellar basal body rod protein FlgC [Pseudomonadales bacterium]